MKVRQSTLGSADTCLRQLQYDLEHPVYHGGITRAIGTAYHHALEVSYQALIDTGAFPDLALVLTPAYERLQASCDLTPSHPSELEKQPGQFKWTKDIADFETATRVLDVMLEAYWAHPEARWDAIDGWEVLAVEESFHHELWNGHTSNGSIDLTLRGPSGEIAGEDHKTAGKNKWAYNKHHARKQNQAPWYVAALRKMYPDAPGYRFFYDIMTHKGVWERRETIVGQAHIEAVEAKALQVVTLYEGMRGAGLDLPANPASNLCSPDYCDHWDICPYGHVLDVQ